MTELFKIEYGILSSDDIRRIAPTEITGLKPTKEKPDVITLSDSKLGVYENGKICPVCNQNNKLCPGHFARIDLVIPVVNPLCEPYVLLFLKCICSHCFRCIITEDDLALHKLDHLTGEARINAIVEISVKKTSCMYCKEQLFLYRQGVKDRNYYRLLKTTSKKIANPKVEITVTDIEAIFSNITNDTVKLLGLDPDRVHPKSIIMRSLLVLPSSDRPNSYSDGNLCEDDLTVMYGEVFKQNEKLKIEPTNSDVIRMLTKYIGAIMDNTDGAVKRPNGVPRKGIKERLSGKQGLVRGKIMGVRVDYAARTVIGPEINIEADEIGVPQIMAEQLSFPEKAHRYNIAKLQKIINTGKANFIEKPSGAVISLNIKMNIRQSPFYPGDKVVRVVKVKKEKGKGKEESKEDEMIDKTITFIPFDGFVLEKGDKIERKGALISDIKIFEKKPYYCEIGDIVHRQLIDGDDACLLNRQPTLHRGSMMGVRIRIHPHRTLRLPLPVTGSYNADFDGRLVAVNSRMLLKLLNILKQENIVNLS